MGTFVALLALSLLNPAISHAPANLATMPQEIKLDWFYLNAYPLLDYWSEGKTWVLTISVTFLLMIMPWLLPRKDGVKAVVDLDNCNGCGLCFDDCPFDAISVQARTDGAKFENEVVVNPELCGACGICTGSCPASNPFRSSRIELKSGIDMPQLTVDDLRSVTNAAIARMNGETNILIFGCEHGFNVNRLDSGDTQGIRLLCSGMLPPTLVEYALKRGAHGVMVTGCRHNDCYFRFGNRWTKMRFDGKRKPSLRGRADRDRIRIHGGAETDQKRIEKDLQAFRAELVKLKVTDRDTTCS